MKKTALILVGMLVLATMSLPVLAQKQKVTMKIGIGTNSRPMYVLKGMYNDKKNIYSGNNFFIQLNPDSGTFNGWVRVIKGVVITVTGTYSISNNILTGTWSSSIGLSGWLSGKLVN